MQTEVAQGDHVLILSTLELIPSRGNRGIAARVNQSPAGREHHTRFPAISIDGIGSAPRDDIAVGIFNGGTVWIEPGYLSSHRGRTSVVTGKRGTRIEVDGWVPLGDLGAQVALGLIHLAGNRLEIGVVDLSQRLHLGQAEGAEFLDRDLVGANRQGQRSWRGKTLQRLGELRCGGGHQFGIHPWALSLDVRGQGQGLRLGLLDDRLLAACRSRDSCIGLLGLHGLLGLDGGKEQGKTQHADQGQSGSGKGHALLKLVPGV